MYGYTQIYQQVDTDAKWICTAISTGLVHVETVGILYVKGSDLHRDNKAQLRSQVNGSYGEIFLSPSC